MNTLNNKLVNRVANSGLITIKLEDFFPEAPIAQFDIKDYLFKGLMLKEKEFRAELKAHDWSQYEGKVLTIFCSSDAIVPVWAYMLVGSYATPFVADIFQGTAADFYTAYYRQVIDQLDIEPYEDKRLVIKGCSDHPVPPSAYMNLTRKLRPIAKSIMYGEPCSTVPVYKAPKK